ncbi:MAG: glycogen debranching protein GlgX [Pseudomonadota bacterium]
MISSGDPTLLGATVVDGGVNFALYSSTAERVQLCLFDEHDDERRLDMQGPHNDVWHGFVPNVSVGARYGYRVSGPWDPSRGLRHNPNKLLIDPYARELSGELIWDDAVFGHSLEDTYIPSTSDSAAFVPRGVVAPTMSLTTKRPLTSWSDTIIYEASVRALTARDHRLAEDVRGRFLGAASDEILGHLKSLGITALELLPVHAYADEHFLVQRGLRNAWGYNTLAFFAPMPRFARSAACAEFAHLVERLHDANIEVVLDVVYNHTAEGDLRGPTLSWRGIDNLAYYRVLPENPDHYVNDTGTGNTINADHPAARQMILDSLRYWAGTYGVDGFRFDLAPILGRHFSGFNTNHPLLEQITNDSVLRHCKLIAEPWDIGPGGYQLGAFPKGWGEWNDRYRDTVRQFWRDDEHQTPAMARRLHGSADIFERALRTPAASVNYVTAHDGFTLRDLASYQRTHNEANGENNLDGHRENHSVNFGIEGATDDVEILAHRRKHRLNLLASLLVSQGTPMILGGDELGRTKDGNNNAYAQDNETTWFDWHDIDQGFLSRVRDLIALRKRIPLLRQEAYRHGRSTNEAGLKNIQWHAPNGDQLDGLDWHHARAVTMLLVATENDAPPSPEQAAVAVSFNPTDTPVEFTLPQVASSGAWVVSGYTDIEPPALRKSVVAQAARSTSILVWVRGSS